jgi:DNA modification methylase
MNITELKPDSNNANLGTDRGRAALAESLKQFGAGRSILVDRKGRVIAGNKTLEQAIAAGHQDVVVVKSDGKKLVAVQRTDLDLGDVKARALAIADNRVGELDLEWNPDALKQITDEGVDLGAFFTGAELASLFGGDTKDKPETSSSNDGQAAALRKKWNTKPGQLWLADNHRLLCGDSTKPADVKRLLAGRRAELVNMDPPYGVSYAGSAGKIKNDNKRGDGLLALLEKSFKQAVAASSPTAAFYIWHATSRRRDFEAALDAAGLEEKQYITWFKDSFVLGRSDYHWQTEPCFYAQKVGQTAPFYGDRAQSTFWAIAPRRDASGTKRVALVQGLRVSDGAGSEITISSKAPKNKKLRLVRVKGEETLLLAMEGKSNDAWQVSHDASAENGHPTPKPIELGIRAIENSTQPGELVFDPFLGGGFSAVAAARTDRICYGMELDPKYLAVTLESLAGEGLEPRLSAE